MVVEGMFLSRTMTTRERETLELCQKVLTVLHVWTMAADLQLETQLARLRPQQRPPGSKILPSTGSEPGHWGHKLGTVCKARYLYLLSSYASV